MNSENGTVNNSDSQRKGNPRAKNNKKKLKHRSRNASLPSNCKWMFHLLMIKLFDTEMRKT